MYKLNVQINLLYYYYIYFFKNKFNLDIKLFNKINLNNFKIN